MGKVTVQRVFRLGSAGLFFFDEQGGRPGFLNFLAEQGIEAEKVLGGDVSEFAFGKFLGNGLLLFGETVEILLLCLENGFLERFEFDSAEGSDYESELMVPFYESGPRDMEVLRDSEDAPAFGA